RPAPAPQARRRGRGADVVALGRSAAACRAARLCDALLPDDEARPVRRRRGPAGGDGRRRPCPCARPCAARDGPRSRRRKGPWRRERRRRLHARQRHWHQRRRRRTVVAQTGAPGRRRLARRCGLGTDPRGRPPRRAPPQAVVLLADRGRRRARGPLPVGGVRPAVVVPVEHGRRRRCPPKVPAHRRRGRWQQVGHCRQVCQRPLL
ncbi:hypothetical protein IWQ57_005226, partial [Coemansia nantahalensis]